MAKIYLIKHWYTVDGGFGDAVYEEETVKVTSCKEFAEEYIKKWSNPRVYDIPYDSLTMHGLKMEEIDIDGFTINTPPTDAWLQTEREIDECKRPYPG